MSDSIPLCLNDSEGAVKMALALVEGGEATCGIEVPSGMFVKHYRETVKRLAPSDEIARCIRIIVQTKGQK